ncbi:MAG: 16S rRNA (uracil(1498)-N(3))-methyltransferase [Pseudomonadota bacterium]
MSAGQGRTPRLHTDCDLPGRIDLTDKQAHYLRSVMRLSPGDTICVFNGRDGEYDAVLEGSGKRIWALALETAQRRPQTPHPSLALAFAPLKQARLDYMVEKAAEMGAGTVIPVLTQHGQVRKVNRHRLRANMIEACEQCGILNVPEIVEPLTLPALLGNVEGRTLVVADEALAGDEMDAVAAIRAARAPLTVLIGPEGGFSDNEREMLAPRAVRVSLGPRVLRADTAAVALLALVEAAHPSVA